MAIEKYKELYDLTIRLLLEEQNRHSRLSEKSTTYFSVFTFIIGLSMFFIKWLLNTIIPPESTFEWILFVLGILLITILVITWFLIFSVHRIHIVNKIPLTTEMIDFYRENRLIDIYYSERLKKILQNYFV